MARLQQILAHHSYIIILIRTFVAYIPWLQSSRLIKMPEKRKRTLLRDSLKIKKNIRMLIVLGPLLVFDDAKNEK